LGPGGDFGAASVEEDPFAKDMVGITASGLINQPLSTHPPVIPGVDAEDAYAKQVAGFSDKTAVVDKQLLQSLALLGVGSVVHQLAIRHPTYGSVVNSIFPNLVGMTVAEARSMLAFLLTSFQGCDKGLTIASPKDDPILRSAPSEALGAARVAASTSRTSYVLASMMSTHFLRTVAPFIRKRSVKDGQFIIECDDFAEPISVPPFFMMDTDKADDLARKCTKLGVNTVSIPLEAERMVKFAMTHVPFTLETATNGVASLVCVTTVPRDHKTLYLPLSPNGLYNSSGFLNPEVRQVISEVYAAINMKPIRPGIKSPLVRVLVHLAFNDLLGPVVSKWTTKVAPFLKASEGTKFVALRTSLAKVQGPPLKTLEPEAANDRYDPVRALEALYTSRMPRSHYGLDGNATFNTFNCAYTDASIGMCTKTRGNLAAVGLTSLTGLKTVVIGVAKGNDMNIFKQSETLKAFDLEPTVAQGVPVDKLDVVSESARLAAEIGDNCDLFYSDVCVSGCGGGIADVAKIAAGCSFTKNALVLTNLIGAVVKAKPRHIVIKTFIPYEKITDVSLPGWFAPLANIYAYRFVKTGKLHNDEFYIVGSSLKWSEQYKIPRYYAGSLLRMSSACWIGNRWADTALAHASILPLFHVDGIAGQKALVEGDVPFPPPKPIKSAGPSTTLAIAGGSADLKVDFGMTL
jgi:hypothetical protein